MRTHQAFTPGTIEVNRLWKRFRADRTRPVLRDEIDRVIGGFRKSGDTRLWRWALHDLGFSIEPGESVGLFGSNGSGKSTLLKILTKVMYPTAGNVKIGGRIGALIEVRAGVHPDLTGRENIYLYGSIMGLRRPEISHRFDAIVDFAELSEALDRQLKYYSSGMAMRLGFAVAAFLSPDVLLVDEVLAVGDATFQQKCLDRMRGVLREGTTLVFVSHDLASIESIATRGLWLRGGCLEVDGPIKEAMSAYRHHIESTAELSVKGNDRLRVAVRVSGTSGQSPASEAPLNIQVSFTSDGTRDVVVFLGITEGSAAPVFSLRRELRVTDGLSTHTCALRQLPLPRGRYWVWLAVTEPTGEDLLAWQPTTAFDVQGADLDPLLPGVLRLSPIHVGAEWDNESMLSVPVDRSLSVTDS